MDQTEVSFEALRVVSATLDLEGLDGDRLRWRTELRGADFAGVILPEPGQVVELFQNGIRIFRGHVSDVRHRHRQSNGSSAGSVDVEVEGPEYFMARIALTDGLVEDQAGNQSERAIVRFSEGRIDQHLATLLERSAVLGVPIDDASNGLEETYLVPPLSFSVSSCWDVLVELLRWVPDSIFFWDYSGALPRARMVRRDAAPVLNYQVGQEPLTGFELVPRIEKEVNQVVLPFARRDEQGRVLWDRQESGDQGDNLRRQLVTVSGQENDTFLPIDLADTTELRTMPLRPDYSFVLQRDGRLQDVGSPALRLGPETFTFRSTRRPLSQGATFRTNGVLAPRAIGDQNQNLNGFYLLESGDIFDWVRTQLGITLVSGTLTGLAYLDHTGDDDPPEFVQDLNMPLLNSGFVGGSGSFPGGRDGVRHRVYVYEFSIPARFIDQEFEDSTTLFRAPEYGFVFPPEGLADNLRAAQSFVPYEGEVSLASRNEFNPSFILGRKARLAGSLPEYEAMDALVQGVSMELDEGSARVRLGSPDRLSFRNLAERFSVSGQDNIVPL